VWFGKSIDIFMSRSLFSRYDFAIINRSFWPVHPVLGEALLQFAERTAGSKKTCVVMQDQVGIRENLKEHGRGKGVTFFPCKAWTTSASGILKRIVDTAFFMLWVVGVLLWTRPRKVYVATDPPVLVPLVVMIYCKMFRASYVYHLQDIHPEAANVVVPLNPVLFRCLRWADGLVMRNATKLITLTEEMKSEILARSGTVASIALISNPAISFGEALRATEVKEGFSFCGNAGRLQRIPLLIEAIQRYLGRGGGLKFAFAGGGVYAADIQALAERHPQVHYHGIVSAEEAARLNRGYRWGLLPIEDEVTRYAFPSKSSSYVFSGALILAICGEQTSVAQWVTSNRLGIVVKAGVGELVNTFQKIEIGEIDTSGLDSSRNDLKSALSIDRYIKNLELAIFEESPIR
jgi:glycosyltransferase involved in cell wall biosynthesis